MGARWYESRIGRWISADTIVPNPSNPQTLNRYAYVMDNPPKYTDPTGHIECLDTQCLLRVHPVSGEVIEYGTPIEEYEWTIEFTAKEGLSWGAAYKQTFYDAAYAAGQRLAPEYETEISPLEAFRRGAGRTTLHRISGDHISGWAETCMDFKEDYCAQGRICYDSSMFAATGIPDYWQNVALNAVHEFGHAFSQRRGRQPDADLVDAWANGFPRRSQSGDLGGFAGSYFGWQQTTRTKASEEFADMFVGWVYGRFHSGPRGAARSEWMSKNMRSWLGLNVDEAGP